MSKLGNAMFTVANDSWGTDTTRPALARGKLLTPVVSLTTGDAWAGMQTTVTDAGNPLPAGAPKGALS